jgi:hypothetical protein
MPKKQPMKPFWEMTTAELREATREFDTPSKDGYGFRRMTPAERARWNRAKRKPGRPKIGKGAKSVLISVERDLLKNADAFARKNKLSRSQLIAGLLRKLPKAG